jgi:hypothetical protein
MSAPASPDKTPTRPDPKAPLVEWAHWYAGVLKWPVFPVKPGQKTPLTTHGFLDATTDSEKIAAWWKQYPNANIGMPTGERSNTLIVDVDIKEWEGKSGDKTLAMLEIEHCPLPSTVKLWTWSGSYQLLFTHRPDVVSRAGAFGQWLDSRSQGGYTILPPSRITDSGRVGQYHWDGDPAGARAELPEWLVTLHRQIVSTNGHRAPSANGKGSIPNGARNDVLYRTGRSLHFKGHGPDSIRSCLATINTTECTQPLDDCELDKIVSQVIKQPDRVGYERKSFPDDNETDELTNSPHEDAVEGPSPLRAPEHAMIGVGRDFADLYHRAYGGPKEYWFWSFMTLFAARLDGLIQHSTENRPRTRMYTVKVGETGIGKSASGGLTVSFFDNLTWPLKILNGAGSGEGVAKAVEKATNNKLLIHLDELATMVTKSSQGTGSTLPPVLTSLFESNQYSNSALATPIEINNASVSILSGCTTDTYSTLFAAGYVNLGFLPRLFLVAGEERMKPEADRAHPSFEEQQSLAEKVEERLRLAVDGRKDQSTGARMYSMTDEARDIQRTWGTKYPENEAPEYVRLGSYGQRLLLSLAAGCGKSEIDGEVARAVSDWLDYEAEVRSSLRPIVADSPWAEMEQKILRALSRGPMKTLDVKRACPLRASRTEGLGLSTGDAGETRAR